MSGPCTDCGGPDYQTLVARIAELEAMLLAGAEMKRGCCANCESCTRAGFCSNDDARTNVRSDYPMQSDFRCRYWAERGKP